MADGVRKINEWIMKDGRIIGITIPDSDPTKFEGGTLYIDPSKGDFRYVNVDTSSIKTWSRFIPENLFDDRTIGTNLLKLGSVTEQILADSSVTNSKYADRSISTNKYQNESITTPKYAKGSIITDIYADLSITEPKIANLAITESKIAEQAVSTTKIKPFSVTDTCIAEHTITRDKLKQKTLTDTEIADLSLITSLYKDKSITEPKIGDLQVSERTLNNNSVTYNKLGIGSVYGNRIPNNAIHNEHIDSMSGFKIEDNTISGSKIMNDSIKFNHISNENVTFSKLDRNTQKLINDSIRVIPSQYIAGETVFNTAFVQGNLRVKNPNGKTTVNVDGDINASGDIVGARVFNPIFADLAEAYIPTEKLEPGDAVCLSEEGDLKIEKLNNTNVERFIGFISNEYAMIFGATPIEIKEKTKVPVTLMGRIKIKYEGELKIGDFICLTWEGELRKCLSPNYHIVARALENKDKKDEKVLCQVFPFY